MGKATVANKEKRTTRTEKYEDTDAEGGHEKYLLRLYMTGTTPRSQDALRNIKRICEEYLKGRYELEVIDIYQHPKLTEGEHIFAAPTLVKKLPRPLRKFIGDLSDEDRILFGLDLKPHANRTEQK